MKRRAGVLIGSLALACNSELRFPDSIVEDAGFDAGGCKVDTDCPLTDLHCDSASATCVECTTDAHCANEGRRRCDTALHMCVACGTNSDCAVLDICEPTTHKCLRTCAMGCPPPMLRCDLGSDRCVECASDAECVRPGLRHTCQLASGECVQCLSDAQCGAPAARCDPVSGNCVPCLVQADCSAGACDPSTHTCIVQQ
jgi:hypothetical protein